MSTLADAVSSNVPAPSWRPSGTSMNSSVPFLIVSARQLGAVRVGDLDASRQFDRQLLDVTGRGHGERADPLASLAGLLGRGDRERRRRLVADAGVGRTGQVLVQREHVRAGVAEPLDASGSSSFSAVSSL